MTTPFNRREFLKTTSLAGVAATAAGHLQAAPQVRSGGSKPTVISSGNGLTSRNGGTVSCVELAFESIVGGSDVLEALIAGGQHRRK